MVFDVLRQTLCFKGRREADILEPPLTAQGINYSSSKLLDSSHKNSELFPKSHKMEPRWSPILCRTRCARYSADAEQQSQTGAV